MLFSLLFLYTTKLLKIFDITKVFLLYFRQKYLFYTQSYSTKKLPNYTC